MTPAELGARLRKGSVPITIDPEIGSYTVRWVPPDSSGPVRRPSQLGISVTPSLSGARLRYGPGAGRGVPEVHQAQVWAR
jgi:hypothetical protein